MIDYIPIDKNIFTFGNDRNFNSLFNLYDFEKDPITNDISVSKLLTVCECLDNYPNIAYFSPDKNCKLSSRTEIHLTQSLCSKNV